MTKAKRTFREERLELIYKVIQEKQKVFVPELAKQFDISESSVRLDLAELESHNLIMRTHGGAILKNGLSSNFVINVDTINNRITHFEKEKDAIAQKTASIIEDGDTIMMDGGSTTRCLAKYLVNKKNLTVITNSLDLIPEFVVNPNVNLYILGGFAFKEGGIVVGPMTNEYITQFHPNKAILGIDGISLDKGLTAANASNPSISSAKVKMVEVSDQLIIVSDHSKLNRVCLMPIAPIEAMDVLVTDSGASPEILEEIRKRGPKVLVA